MLESIYDDPFVGQISRLLVEGFGLPGCRKVERMPSGLINETYLADDVWVVQRVNGMFGPGVNEDIAHLVPILRARGVCVPEYGMASGGGYAVEGRRFGLAEGRWRVMTKLPGKSVDKVDCVERIRALAAMMARFHRALDGVVYHFKNVRVGVHDFERHRAGLVRAMEEKRAHRLWKDVEGVWSKIAFLERYIKFDNILLCEDRRIVHGDLKVSNFLFEGNEVSGVIDLDTMALSRVAFDVGDAIRSWCNPRTENEEPEFDAEWAREAMGVYLEEVGCLSRGERLSLADAAPFIALELSMRFARDALCEDYFGFDPEIGHGEHSLLRARNMANLCEQMLGRDAMV